MTLIPSTSVMGSRQVCPIAILAMLYAVSQCELASAQDKRIRELHHAVDRQLWCRRHRRSCNRACRERDGSWAVIIGLVVLIAVILHSVRVRQIARAMGARFDERLDERTREARELHDALLQTVHGSKLVADRALRDTTDRAQLVAALAQLSVWLGQAATEGRVALQSLRGSTTERNDLTAAFRRAIEECRTAFSGEMPLSVHGLAREMHPMVRDEVYRIGYEAIRNACVHSRATRIDIALEYGHDLTLQISDNGVGMAAVTERGKEGHSGLRGMRDRAERVGATLTLVSDPGAGTVITLVVPGRIVFL